MNPQLIIGAVIVALAFASGWKVNGWRIESSQNQAEDAAQKAATAATDAAVAEIKKIEVKYVTIKQRAETVTREVPIYRDCLHDDSGLQLVNQALTGSAAPTDPASLPGPDTPR